MSKEKSGKRKQRPELKNLLLLLILNLEGEMGRYRLKNLLGLSDHEGIVKLMLNELSSEGYIEANRTGCRLTTSGEAFLQEMLRKYNITRIKNLDLNVLGLEGESFVLQINGQYPQRLVELRDVAVRAGAGGMVLVYNEGGHLKIPAVCDNLDLERPAMSKRLRDLFDVSLSDMFMIGLAEDKWRALEGALAAAMKLK